MVRTISILLLYEDNTWREYRHNTELREISVEYLYETIPPELKTDKLMKIVRLGFDSCWQNFDVNHIKVQTCVPECPLYKDS